jgi:hypothetical protein
MIFFKIAAMLLAAIAAINAYYIPNPLSTTATVFLGLMAIILATWKSK